MLPVVLAHSSSVLKAFAVQHLAGGEYLFYHDFGISTN